jgi:Xaa-Pro aminopeptidase
MAVEGCIPVQVGLQLMDSSTLGRADREPDFLRAHRQIQKALKTIVNGKIFFQFPLPPSSKDLC